MRAIACDLDRTLIGEDLALRPRTLAALAGARDAGLHVVIATGRMFRSVRPYAAEAGLGGPVVCYQGAVVADPGSGEFLLHEPIPVDTAREAIAAVEAEGFTLNCYVGDELYVSAATDGSRRYATFQHIPLHEVGPLAEWISEPPTKLVAIDEPDVLDELEVRMKARFEGRLEIAKSLPFFLEFAASGVTKATGLQFVADRLGFTAAETVAFGDGENDIEMLRWAGRSFAVANAHPRALAAADEVCPGVEDEGVAQTIEALLDSMP